jgi:hypothetical protein
MKRFYATIALSTAIVTGAFAQRNVALSVTINAPLSGTNIVTGSTTYPSYTITNNGPDSVKVGDTLWLIHPGVPSGQANTLALPQALPPGSSVTLDTNVIQGGAASWGLPFSNIKTLWNINNVNVATPIVAPFTDDSEYAWLVYLQLTAPASNGSVSITGSDYYDTVHVWINKANSIREVAQAENLQCYPNPASAGEVSFNFNYAAAAAATIRVMDAAGRTVLAKELAKNGMGNQKISVDVSGLSNGNYFLEFICDDRKATGRFSIRK